MRSFSPVIYVLFCLILSASAQFQFFEQMFGGGGGGGQQQQQAPQNVRSDSSWYHGNWKDAHCSNFLCPHTLSCVDKPTHCPCAFPDVEEKAELGEGIAICASKGGWKEGETLRKIELARKGFL